MAAPSLTRISIPRKAKFRRQLLCWYDGNRRDLPWRRTTDPYKIWVSEIMLQQTRVNAVLDHYRRFLKVFPTVKALAKSSEQDVLAQWSGLGYYRRARMMHRAAKEVVGAHGSKFPACADELRQLPGIGRYTAAAVASIAFNQKSAVVDGNVARVMERMMGVSLPEKAVWQLMEDAICLERPGDFNQAMMELGASVCTPKNPLCGECPVKSWCVTRGERPAALKVVRRSASLHYLYATSGKSVQLVQRSANDSLMAGMWELPSAVASSTEPLFTLKHSITNTDYQVFVFRGASRGRAGGKTVDFGDVEKLPLTGLTRKILKRMGAIANPV